MYVREFRTFFDNILKKIEVYQSLKLSEKGHFSKLENTYYMYLIWLCSMGTLRPPFPPIYKWSPIYGWLLGPYATASLGMKGEGGVFMYLSAGHQTV